MSFNVFARFPVPTIALAVSAVLTGCGGGGSSDQETSTVEASATSTTPGVSTSSASTATGPSTTTSTAASSTGTDTATSTSVSTSTDTTAQQSGDTSTVAVADTTAATSLGVGGGVAVVSAASTRSGVGMNLTSVNSYSPEMPTIDLMKKASPWMTQCQNAYQTCTGFTGSARAYDTLEEASLPVDANGWVTSLPAASDTTVKYRSVTTKIAEGGVQQAGTYTVLYDGSGTITYSGMATKVASQSTPGRDVITVTNNAVGVYLNIVATDPKNYIRNIRVYAPGGACKSDLTTYVAAASSCAASTGGFVPFESFPAGTVWHPAFIASLKGFRTLRFMDWAQTNYTQAVNWTDRTPATARSWYVTTGVPLESMLDLAGKVGADPWVNIPAHATDDYVHQWAQDAHAHLAAGSNINVEYGNEMWNWAFASTRWVLAQAEATWPTVSASSNIQLLESNWYAMRTAQVCNIVKSEFGTDSGRVKCVANTQAASPVSTSFVLDCTLGQRVLGQPCSKFIDAVAIAPYFGYYFQNNTAIQTAMKSWYSDADGGLTKMFEEINGTDSTGQSVIAPLSVSAATTLSTGALAQATGWMVAQHAVTAKYNIPLWAYEGGQSLVPTAGDTNMLNLMAAANRDARMGATYQTMMTAWKNAGGQTFTFFADVGTYGSGGMWGLRENQFDTSTPKWKTATQWRSQACWWTGC